MSQVRLKQLAQDGATNGEVIKWNNSAGIWEANTDATGGGGGGIPPGIGRYEYDSATGDSDPGTGKFRYSVALTANGTLYIDDINDAGINLDVNGRSFWADQVRQNDMFIIQKTDDETITYAYKVTGLPVDGAGYWKFPLTHIDKGSNATPLATTEKVSILWLPAPPEGGPAFSFRYTQVSDGAANPSTGEWRVRTGSSGTPSGITQLRFHPTDFEGDDQAAAMDILGQGDHVKIWKESDPREWYIYKLSAAPANAGSSWTAEVEHIGDSGGTFDESDEWMFFWYTGSKIQVYTYQESFDVTLASNLNYQTLESVDLGVTTFPTEPQLGDINRAGFITPAFGTIVSVGISGYAPSTASGNSIIFRAFVHNKTINTRTDLTANDTFFTKIFSSNNVWVDGASGGYIDGGAAGSRDVGSDTLVSLLAKRSAAGSPTLINVVLSIRFIVGI